MRILLIQEPFRRLKLALEGQGHLVETADGKAPGDDKARAAGLIVIDLETAGPDALMRLRGWRENGIAAPVLALASRRAPEERVEALDSGADAFVQKPYHRDELLAQIRAMLRRAPAEQDTRIRLNDLKLDPSEYLVKRGGRTIKLTRREFEVFHFLACHRGQVVTREQIWAHLSGQDQRNSNLIDVYIRYLRRKIDRGFETPLIVTCWGKGYCLRGDAEWEQAS